MLWAAIIAAACSDAPTATSAAGGTQIPYATARPSQDVLLDPVIVIGQPRECDPWLDLNWCKDGGTCMTSVRQHDRPDEVYMSSCPGDGSGSGGGDGGGGGGSTQPTHPADPECNPQYDPDCNQPLTPADSTTLKNGLTLHINTQFTDQSKAEQCRQMKAEFDRLMAAGNVFRGQFDTPENDPQTAVHVGAYDPVSGTMHFEPSALDAANAGDATAIRNIVNTALHEAAHSLGFDHTEPLWMGSYDLYAEAPFNLLSPGTNSCITGW
jgi:hypothetical protein